MEIGQIESYVHDYLVSLYLLKAVEVDRATLRDLKLYRAWDHFFQEVSIAAERHHVQVRQKLRASGCRIVVEEVLDNKHLHVMYVHRRYEHHCYLMPLVLKARCEELLQGLLKNALKRTHSASLE